METLVEEITLLPFEDRHFAQTAEWFGDPVILKGLLKSKIESRHSLNMWLGNFYKQPNCHHFAIYDNYEHVGNVSLRNIDWVGKTGEMLIYIGKGRGRRAGFKALKMFLSYCFDVKLLNKVYITVGADNLVARHLYKICGFAQERVFKGVFFNGKKYIDVIKMSKTKGD